MRYLFTTLFAVFFTFNTYASGYNQEDIDAILQENIKAKAILAKAGLALDYKNYSVKIVDSAKLMSMCDVVIFTDKEFDALNASAAQGGRGVPTQTSKGTRSQLDAEEANLERDFRKAAGNDYHEKSKSFWNNVIY